MRSRVGINASIIGENPTGLGIYSIKLIRELDRIRDDLVVYTSCPEALGPLRARIAPVPSGTRPERSVRGHFARLLWLQSVLWVKARIDHLGVILNTVPEGILGCPVPQVTVVHDLLPLFFPAEYPRQQYYFGFLVPRVLQASRIVVADSESTRRNIVRYFGLPPGNVRVIYPGYDAGAYFCDRVHPSHSRHEEPYLLYVGNLLPHKNLLRLLDALAILRRRRPCRLIIRGEGRPAYVQAVAERVETLGLTGAVVFVGYTGESVLRDLYVHAACLVLPSLSEGFGLPVLEAMACGTPVVVANTSSLPEVVGDAALQVDPNDAVALADALFRVLTDPALREDLRQRGLRRVEAFGWRRTAMELSDVLDQVSSKTTFEVPT
jgi:glycosyltransferase involved in cell wall biosynthesis